MTTDQRVFHFTVTTGLAACGQRLGPLHLGNSARGLVQVGEQYGEDLACPACLSIAVERLAARS